MPVAPPKARLFDALRRVAEWDPGDDTLSVPAIDRATLAELENTLEPTPVAMIAVEVGAVLAIYDPPKGSIKAHTDACVEALLDMPPDILRNGLRRLRIERCYPTAPMPGDFRRACLGELHERRMAVTKARVAAMRYRPAPPPPREPTEAEITQVSAMTAQVYARTRDNPLKGPPEPRPAGTDISSALRAVAAETAGRRLPDADDPEVRKWLGAA